MASGALTEQTPVVARPGVLGLRTGEVDTTRLPNLLTHPGAGFEKSRRYVLVQGPCIA